jgi:hypothetical protein
MGALNLVPLVILSLVLGGIGWVLYQVCLCHASPSPPRTAPLTWTQVYMYSNELAERGVRKMEKKNVVFTKDGAKVGVREVSAEEATDRTQRAFVKTWNAAHERRVLVLGSEGVGADAGRWLTLAGMTGHRVRGHERDKRAGACEVDQDRHWGHWGHWLGTALGGMRAHDTKRRFCLCRWGREEQATCAGLAQGAFTAGQRRCLGGEGQGAFAASSRVGLPMNTNAALYSSWSCFLLTILLTRFHHNHPPCTHYASRTTHHVRTATRDAHQGRRSDGRRLV